VDSDAPDTIMDNLMDSQKQAAHRLPTIVWISHKDYLSTGAWKTYKTKFSTLSTLSTTTIKNGLDKGKLAKALFKLPKA